MENHKRFLLTSLAIYVLILFSHFVESESTSSNLYLFASFMVLLLIAVVYLCVLGLRQRPFPAMVKKHKPYLDNRVWENQKLDILIQIEEVMEKDKPYKAGDFSISKLAVLLNTNPTYISKVLQDCKNVPFQVFVNRYRVQEVKRLLVDPAYRHYTILSIALEAGFKSKASFNRVFKELEGITPTDYINGNTCNVLK